MLAEADAAAAAPPVLEPGLGEVGGLLAVLLASLMHTNTNIQIHSFTHT